MLLQLTGVTKRFGDLSAVKDLSFDVKPGEIFGIAGPNGAGKTTLFNLITGYLPFKGQIIFEKKDINGLRPHKICHMGIVRTFQMPELFETFNVIDTVNIGSHFGRKNNGRIMDVDQILDILGLSGKENLFPSQLDLFDKKMTMLAASLATHPKLLLLDEPIAGLSLPQIKKSVALIKKLRNDFNITILIIEHFMDVLTDISDTLMILHDGRVICTGKPEDVVQDEVVLKVYTGIENA